MWKILEKRFASISCSLVLGLRDELMSLKKGTKTIDSFFQRIKEICDKLSAIVVCVDEEELIHLALKRHFLLSMMHFALQSRPEMMCLVLKN